jgi:outer membrane protein TolC/ABC-type uncharacterized transport system substrate-binding protein
MIGSRWLACFAVLFTTCAALAAPAQTPASAASADGDAQTGSASRQVSETLNELSGPRPVMTVGLLLDGPPQRGDAADRFKAEVTEMLGKVYDVRFDQRQGDWTLPGIRKAMDGLLSAPKVDAVVTVGFVGSIDACRRGSLKKPVIAARVVDSELLALPRSGTGSGVSNLVYIAAGNPLTRDLNKFQEMRPFTKLAFVANGFTVEAMKGMQINLAGEFKKRGLDVRVVPAGGDAAATVAAIAPDTEAVYYGPTTNLSTEQFAALSGAVNTRRLPSFSMTGLEDVKDGALATLVPEGELRRLARRVANYLQRIVMGAQAGELPVEFKTGEALAINMETARTIGWSPAWKLTAEADLLNEEATVVAHEYNLVSGVQGALSGNLDLSEKERALRASAQNVPAATANLLPQVDAKSTASFIDKELASSFQPERLWTGSVVVNQLVYDEMAHANVVIQKRLQEGLEHEYAGFELDIIQLAADAYFNVLRVKAFESIQRANLRKTRANLEIARVREEVGVAGPGEVYRWEAQAAQNRIEVINAGALRRAAEFQFNRVLNRPEQETFRLAEVGVNEDILLTGEKDVVEFLADPVRFEQFCNFAVEAGLREAPELKQIDSGIQAGSRLYAARLRRYYVPTMGVQAEMKYKLYAGGKGTESTLVSGLIPGTPEQSLTVGIQGSLPLYTGGRRKAERIQARESLESLRIKRAAVAQKLEQRIRTAAENAHASHTNIAESRTASEAAAKSLNLVTIGYGRGVVNVTDLLDAQTASHSAELGASSTVYNFMLALMELYRSVGVVGFLEPAERRAQWVGDLKSWCEKHADASTRAPAMVSVTDAAPVKAGPEEKK